MMFNDPTIMGIRVIVNGERVEGADLDFICDGDELLVVREADILLEASTSTTANDDASFEQMSSTDLERHFGIEENRIVASSSPIAPRRHTAASPRQNMDSPTTETSHQNSQPRSADEWITLNVGGTKFLTCRSTIEMKVINVTCSVN